MFVCMKNYNALLQTNYRPKGQYMIHADNYVYNLNKFIYPYYTCCFCSILWYIHLMVYPHACVVYPRIWCVLHRLMSGHRKQLTMISRTVRTRFPCNIYLSLRHRKTGSTLFPWSKAKQSSYRSELQQSTRRESFDRKTVINPLYSVYIAHILTHGASEQRIRYHTRCISRVYYEPNAWTKEQWKATPVLLLSSSNQ